MCVCVCWGGRESPNVCVCVGGTGESPNVGARVSGSRVGRALRRNDNNFVVWRGTLGRQVEVVP
jgi:hypothetical protein